MLKIYTSCCFSTFFLSSYKCKRVGRPKCHGGIIDVFGRVAAWDFLPLEEERESGRAYCSFLFFLQYMSYIALKQVCVRTLQACLCCHIQGLIMHHNNFASASSEFHRSSSWLNRKRQSHLPQSGKQTHRTTEVWVYCVEQSSVIWYIYRNEDWTLNLNVHIK